MLKVKKNSLLMIACLVWGIAGINILRIGLLAYPAYVTVGNIILSVAVFSVFQYFIFGKLVKKHTQRIRTYKEEKQFFLKFFDVKSFVIMAVMMTGGIYIRESGLGPEIFTLQYFILDLAHHFCWQGFFLAEIISERSASEKNSTEMLLNYRKGDKYYAGFWRNFI